MLIPFQIFYITKNYWCKNALIGHPVWPYVNYLQKNSEYIFYTGIYQNMVWCRQYCRIIICGNYVTISQLGVIIIEKTDIQKSMLLNTLFLLILIDNDIAEVEFIIRQICFCHKNHATKMKHFIWKCGSLCKQKWMKFKFSHLTKNQSS